MKHGSNTDEYREAVRVIPGAATGRERCQCTIRAFPLLSSLIRISSDECLPRSAVIANQAGPRPWGGRELFCARGGIPCPWLDIDSQRRNASPLDEIPADSVAQRESR